MKNPIVLAISAVLGLGALPTAAVELSLSGYGTAGYTQSDQSYNYLYFVNNKGTLKSDSVLGAQLDAKLNDEFGFTLQGKVAPSMKSDKGVASMLMWAFLSWRPSNDWLLRVGRMRTPLYLNSENMDVGITYDFAKLPAEVYTTSQATDGNGVQVSKTWNFAGHELTLLGSSATDNAVYRLYQRDGAPSPGQSSGAYFVPVRQKDNSLVLTLQRENNTFRFGVHDAHVSPRDEQLSQPVTFPFVTILPGIGYYQTSNLLPGPGVPAVRDVHFRLYALGADVDVGNDFRVIGEYVRREVRNVVTGPDSQAGYLALLKSAGAWTPYISVARLLSKQETRDLYNRVNSNTVPGFIPYAALLNASQRAGADGIAAYDQSTWALGTSYRINPTSKVKAEWARTKVGDMSALIDAPPGGESGKKVINVFSLSYSVVF